MIIERTIEMQKDIYMCFVDFEKAFDMVRHEDLIRILQMTRTYDYYLIYIGIKSWL